MTTGNRAQRRARTRPELIRSIAKATPFTPKVIGVITLKEQQQLKARTEVLEDCQRRARLLNIEIQVIESEARGFVTTLGQIHGNPAGGTISIDSETGEIKLVSLEEPPAAAPVEASIAEDAPAEDAGPNIEPG